MPRRFSGAALLQALSAYSDTMERKVRRAFFDAIKQFSSTGDLPTMMRQLQQGQIVPDDLPARIEQLSMNTDEIARLVQQAVKGAGSITAKEVGFETAWDVTQPSVITVARDLANRTLVDVQSNTMRTLADTVEEAIVTGMHRDELVRQIRRNVGLLPQHAVAVQRYEQNLLNQGQAPSQAAKLSNGYANRLLSYRAKMVARTEVARARSHGQQMFWDQAEKRRLLPADTQRVWITAQDERTCPVCAPMDGVLVGLHQPWATDTGPVDVPTDVHPQCRCAMGLVFPGITKHIVKFNPYHDELGRFTTADNTVTTAGFEGRGGRGGGSVSGDAFAANRELVVAMAMLGVQMSGRELDPLEEKMLEEAREGDIIIFDGSEETAVGSLSDDGDDGVVALNFRVEDRAEIKDGGAEWVAGFMTDAEIEVCASQWGDTLNNDALALAEVVVAERHDMWAKTAGDSDSKSLALQLAAAEMQEWDSEQIANRVFRGLDPGGMEVARAAADKAVSQVEKDPTPWALMSSAGQEEVVNRHLPPQDSLVMASNWMQPVTPQIAAMALVEHRFAAAANKAVLAAEQRATRHDLPWVVGDAKTITLYRGVMVDKERVVHSPTHVEYRLPSATKVRSESAPLSSWSAVRAVAETFAGLKGVVLEAEVPISSIVGLSTNGFGCISEGEVIVNGDSFDAIVMGDDLEKSASLGGPAPAGEVHKAILPINLDATDENQDWPKRTPDTYEALGISLRVETTGSGELNPVTGIAMSGAEFADTMAVLFRARAPRIVKFKQMFGSGLEVTKAGFATHDGPLSLESLPAYSRDLRVVLGKECARAVAVQVADFDCGEVVLYGLSRGHTPTTQADPMQRVVKVGNDAYLSPLGKYKFTRKQWYEAQQRTSRQGGGSWGDYTPPDAMDRRDDLQWRSKLRKGAAQENKSRPAAVHKLMQRFAAPVTNTGTCPKDGESILQLVERNGRPTPVVYSAVTKFNPYHDELGRFTTADAAVTTSGNAMRANRGVAISMAEVSLGKLSGADKALLRDAPAGAVEFISGWEPVTRGVQTRGAQVEVVVTRRERREIKRRGAKAIADEMTDDERAACTQAMAELYGELDQGTYGNRKTGFITTSNAPEKFVARQHSQWAATSSGNPHALAIQLAAAEMQGWDNEQISNRVFRETPNDVVAAGREIAKQVIANAGGNTAGLLDHETSSAAIRTVVQGDTLSPYLSIAVAGPVVGAPPRAIGTVTAQTFIYSELLGAAYKAVLAANQRVSQKRLKEAVGDTPTITLFRGVYTTVASLFGDEFYGGGEQAVTGGKIRSKSSPLSSWSVSRPTARKFAVGYDQEGVVLRAEIPVSSIVGVSSQGFGCIVEGEVVVNGDSFVAKVDTQASDITKGVAGRPAPAGSLRKAIPTINLDATDENQDWPKRTPDTYEALGLPLPIVKFNPYHDDRGRFTTAANNTTGSQRVPEQGFDGTPEGLVNAIKRTFQDHGFSPRHSKSAVSEAEYVSVGTETQDVTVRVAAHSREIPYDSTIDVWANIPRYDRIGLGKPRFSTQHWTIGVRDALGRLGTAPNNDLQRLVQEVGTPNAAAQHAELKQREARYWQRREDDRRAGMAEHLHNTGETYIADEWVYDRERNKVVTKFNPYHDELGRFTTARYAVTISGGNLPPVAGSEELWSAQGRELFRTPLRSKGASITQESAGGEVQYTIQYGDLQLETRAASAEEALGRFDNEWVYWEGNYRLRHASAAIVGLPPPKSVEHVTDALSETIATGDASAMRERDAADAVTLDRLRAGEKRDDAWRWSRSYGAQTTVDEAVGGVVARAYEAMRAVGGADETSPLLHRGMSDVDRASPLLSAPIGTKYGTALTAFSPDPSMAMRFTHNDREKGAPEVLVVLKPGAKSYVGDTGAPQVHPNPVWAPNKGWRFDGSIEHITQGVFKIVDRFQPKGVDPEVVGWKDYLEPGRGHKTYAPGEQTQGVEWVVVVEQVGSYLPNPDGTVMYVENDKPSGPLPSSNYGNEVNTFDDVAKFNPYHDELGRFTTADKDVTGVASDLYQGMHKPSADSAPLYDLLDDDGWFPDDVYTSPSLYMFGDRAIQQETLSAIRHARGRPDALVTVYRSVPPGTTAINSGDWVALSRSYAEQHGQDRVYEYFDADAVWPDDESGKGMWVSSRVNWAVLSAEVPAHTIRSGGNDLIEWGYWGGKIEAGGIKKFNPYHDELGRFTTADNNVTGAATASSDQAGGRLAASQILSTALGWGQREAELLAAHGPSLAVRSSVTYTDWVREPGDLSAGLTYTVELDLNERNSNSTAVVGLSTRTRSRVKAEGIANTAFEMRPDELAAVNEMFLAWEPDYWLTGMEAAEALVEEVHGRWSQTAGDHSEGAMALQLAAAQEAGWSDEEISSRVFYGLSDNDYQNGKEIAESAILHNLGSVADSMSRPIKASQAVRNASTLLFASSDEKFVARVMTLAHMSSAANKAYLAASKRLAQEAMKDVGGPQQTVTLYRGVQIPKSRSTPYSELGSKVVNASSPLSSWSWSLSAAIPFMRYGGVEADEVAYVVKAEVPVSAIVGVASQGWGCLSEGEVIVDGTVPFEAQTIAYTDNVGRTVLET